MPREEVVFWVDLVLKQIPWPSSVNLIPLQWSWNIRQRGKYLAGNLFLLILDDSRIYKDKICAKYSLASRVASVFTLFEVPANDIIGVYLPQYGRSHCSVCRGDDHVLQQRTSCV